MLKELLKDHRLYHSQFQQDNFITKSGGTEYGQYKQSLREVYKRVRGLRDLKWDREKLLVEIDEQKYISGTHENEFRRRKAEIEYKRKIMQLEESERTIRDNEREFKRFYQQACILKEKLGDLTPEKRRKLEEELWIYKTKEMMVTDWLCEGRRSRQTHEMLCSLPWRIRTQLIEETSGENSKEAAEKQLALIDEFIDNENDYFEDLKELEVDVKCILDQ